MSMMILAMALIALGAALTFMQFKVRSLPLTLASAAIWLTIFFWLFLGDLTWFDKSTSWGQTIPFIFILLTFVPILTFIGRMGKKEITTSGRQGSYTDWAKPENLKLSRATQVKARHRERVRSAVSYSSESRRSRLGR